MAKNRKRHKPAPIKQIQLPDHVLRAVSLGNPDTNIRAFEMGGCRILLEFHNGGVGWHLSISRPDRLPSYYELKRARYTLIPNDVTMAQIFPPKEQFVNLHENTLHLYQVQFGNQVPSPDKQA